MGVQMVFLGIRGGDLRDLTAIGRDAHEPGRLQGGEDDGVSIEPGDPGREVREATELDDCPPPH